MDSMEAKIDEKSIERDLAARLRNAEFSEKSNPGQASVLDVPKPKCVLPDTGVRLLVDFKNRLEANYLSKDLDEDAKEFISNYLQTTPEEIEVWKRALEETGDRYLPVEYIEWILKYLNSPVFILVESEVKKIAGLKGALVQFQKKKEAV